MKRIQLLPIRCPEPKLLGALRRPLQKQFQSSVEILPADMDPDFAFSPERQQYRSTDILERMRSLVGPEVWRLLGVTSVDLYIPILTFVFGEAQLGGACAVISYHRLHEEFYGLPRDPKKLVTRFVKEAVHELGHTLGLRHCDDYRCAMASSHDVTSVDIKGSDLCPQCRSTMRSP